MTIAGMISWPFYNRRERRLRLWLRFTLTGVLIYALDVALLAAAAALGLAASTPAGFVRTLLAISTGVLLARWLLDRQKPHAAPYALRDTAAGFIIGGIAQTVIFVTALAAGWLHIDSSAFAPASGGSSLPIAQALGIYTCVGIYEELAVRGYLLPNIAQSLARLIGARWALLAAWLLSAFIFGAAHLLNPHASTLGTLLIAGAGLMLGLSPLLTGSISLAVGVHIGWNWFMGAVYGFAVSGTRVNDGSVFHITLSGSELWTGGAFGPEAGILGIIGIGIAALLMVLWIRKRRGALRLAGELSEYKAIWYI
ncbi:MAG: CPBP family intramembrane metalloprotease [Chloroflexi bacterium]|nr:CPBP family intramembrane metalloprotease [Chloroflexota bacterium]